MFRAEGFALRAAARHHFGVGVGLSAIRKERRFESFRRNRRSFTTFRMTLWWVEDDGDERPAAKAGCTLEVGIQGPEGPCSLRMPLIAPDVPGPSGLGWGAA